MYGGTQRIHGRCAQPPKLLYMIDIDGKWIGFYTYDNGYGELTKLEPVPFTIVIKKAFDHFVGRVTEDEDFGGIDDEILVKGRLNGTEIEFTKYYTLEHIVNERGETDSFESENPTIVHYEGEYFENELKFKGKWEIGQLKEIDDEILIEDNNFGVWEMWRE